MSQAPSLIALGVLASLAGVAHAERKPQELSKPRPWTGYIKTPNAKSTSSAVSSRIVYMRRCKAGGCQLHQGNDDSRTDTSSIPNGDRILSEFMQGDEVWAALMDCARTTFAPFDITVTDIDPGTTPHFENVVGGKASELGRSDLTNAGGVAPFDCGEIPNAIVFTFDVYGPDAQALCWTSAQEVAHAFGLEHEYLQKDPLTYLQGDLPKRYRDVSAQCGEYELRACDCGGTEQNTYRTIVGLFGPGAPTPPEVVIKRPKADKPVQPGFTVVVDAQDDVRVEKVELYVDGVLAGESTTPIADVFELATPEMTSGPHSIEVKATDVQGIAGSVTQAIEMGAPCTRSTICSDTDVCVDGVCLPGPDEPGGLGSICQSDTECLSHRCADGGAEFKHCVEECDASNSASCPNDFSCIAAGATGVCWPDPAGCCSATTTPQGPILLGLGVGLLLLRRRRPRS